MTDKLMEQIAAPENLLSAWRAVRGNIPKYRRERASGPDGVSLAEFERELQPQLAALRDMLLRGRYYPMPPARFKLPKRGGGERVIAVLAVRERVAQRAAQQVLEPLWEPEFLPCSFGFRPGASIEQAVTYIHEQRQHGERWVVDGDIAACFDSLDHDILMARIQEKARDRRVLKLAQNWLDAGLMQSGLPAEADPQAAIHAHQRRRKVMKALEGFGLRVQYSVFECLLTPAQMVEMQRKLKKLVGKDDSVRFYFISADDVKRIALLGGANVTVDRPFILH